MTKPPILATLVVLAAVVTMIALGLWQVERASEKEALLARLEAATGLPAVPLPSAAAGEIPLFRRTSADCRAKGPSRVVAGRNLQGASGFAHWVECEGFRAEIGWSGRPEPVHWSGGTISGTIAPDRQRGFRLVSDRGLAGLQPSAPPNIADIPNNHRSYAFQWFAFAAAALIIYGLALKGRRKES